MKLKFPIAKIRKEDGCPAIWLTFNNWLLLRHGIFRSYLEHRRYYGEHRARIDAKRPDEILDYWAKQKSDYEAAFALYEIGWEAHKSIHLRNDPEERINFSPQKLKERGDQEEKKAYEEKMQYLSKTPVISNLQSEPRKLSGQISNPPTPCP